METQETRSTTTHLSRLALIALSVLVSSCGHSSSSTVSGCVLNSDQGGTINGRWIQAPVPIAFQSGAFTNSEVSVILQAVQTWNNFFAKSMGYPAIDAGSPRVSTQALPSDSQVFCANESAINADYSFTGSKPIVIYKDTSWPSDYGSAVIAYTSVCHQPALSGKLIPYFSNAYIELNYQNFFTTTQVPDLQSIVLHEFGHLMGLRHSCESNSSQSGMPNCDSASLPYDYRKAVMYPSFTFFSSGGFSIGEERRSLNANDQGRMNCVYQDL